VVLYLSHQILLDNEHSIAVLIPFTDFFTSSLWSTTDLSGLRLLGDLAHCALT